MRRAVFKIAQRELNNKTEDRPKSTPSPRKLQKALMRRLRIKERYWYPTKRFINWKACALSLPSRSKDQVLIDRAEIENLKKRQAIIRRWKLRKLINNPVVGARMFRALIREKRATCRHETRKLAIWGPSNGVYEICTRCGDKHTCLVLPPHERVRLDLLWPSDFLD